MAVTLPKSRALDILNLTPIIDMVFLLLIFFLIASKLEEEERHLQISMPRASAAKPLIDKPQQIRVSISATGEYEVAGAMLNLQGLEANLRQAAADNPGRQVVVIRADGRSPTQYLINVISLCHAVGIDDYRLAASAEERKP